MSNEENTTADNPIVIKQEFNASIDNVWDAITNHKQMIKWYFEMIPDFKPIVGFETSFNVHTPNNKDYLHIWKVMEVIPKQKIVYSWKYGGYAGDTFVVWELMTKGNKTNLNFSHHGLNSFPQDNSGLARENFVQGWTFIINKLLKDFLENNKSNK